VAVSFAIRRILLGRSVGEIVNPIVIPDSIQVSGLLPWRAWTNEGR
jgi:hypothetical protein